MKIPVPEKIIVDTDLSIEEVLDNNRDILYPKLLEIIRYCHEYEVSEIPFLEVVMGDESIMFNIPPIYTEQIQNTIEYYVELEEYEICQELDSYLNFDS